MAIVTARLLAPLNGTISQTDSTPPYSNCCSTCSHSCCPATCGVYKTDIGAPALTAIKVWGDSEVRSFHVQQIDSACCSYESDLYRGMKVTLYNQPNFICPVGWVLYGHVRSPRNTGWHNYNPSGVTIGLIPNTSNCYSCYCGSHVHLEIGASSGVTMDRARSTCSSVTLGSTSIYKWTFDNFGC